MKDDSVIVLAILTVVIFVLGLALLAEIPRYQFVNINGALYRCDVVGGVDKGKCVWISVDGQPLK